MISSASTFEGRHARLGPVVGAIVPASKSSAAIGMVSLGAYFVLSGGPIELANVSDIIALVVIGGIALLTGWAAAIIVVGFYLALFGLPVALLLDDRIRHPIALAVALLDASISALLVVSGSALNLIEGDSFHLPTFGIVLCFALPAGYLYRRGVIALRDKAEAGL